MITQTRKAFAVAAIVATGFAAIGLAQADTSPTEGYAGARVDAAFQVVAEMPSVEPISIPVAVKGDLQIPIECVGPFRPDVQAECMDVAYEVESGPYVVVEARTEDTSILTRMLGYTMAIFEGGNQETQ
jgi:hypothetical protein